LPNLELEHIIQYHKSFRDAPGSFFDNGVWANFVNFEDRYVGCSRFGNCAGDDKIDVFHLDSEFNLIYRNILTEGEDPRTFMYNGIPHCITWHPHGSPRVFDYKIINLITEQVSTLTIEDFPETRVELLGKNWIPLVKDGVLYFVLTIDPQLSIIKYNPETHHCVWETSHDLVQNITISRGGTPLVFSDNHDCYFGVGHRTHDCHNHSPFLYMVSSDLKESYIGPDLWDGNVSDPLSIYEKDKKIYCCVGHSNIQLGDTTEVGASLYEVKFT
tara:strand:- start:5173 stop:5988 length:816 start_codon:yes stop_codon:yes gene_type:complete